MSVMRSEGLKSRQKVASAPDTAVWRYLSLPKFLWLLQRKALWLSNMRTLQDAWEGSPPVTVAAEDLNRANAYPATMKGSYWGHFIENQKAIQLLRASSYVSCWTQCSYESFALWKLYCSTNDGVAIQTSLKSLRRSLGRCRNIAVYQVRYSDEAKFDWSRISLVTSKRASFSFEQEVRVVWFDEQRGKRSNWPPEDGPAGVAKAWDPQRWIDRVVYHPESCDFTREVVRRSIETFAPKLLDRLAVSEIAPLPPYSLVHHAGVSTSDSGISRVSKTKIKM